MKVLEVEATQDGFTVLFPPLDKEMLTAIAASILEVLVKLDVPVQRVVDAMRDSPDVNIVLVPSDKAPREA